MSEIPTPSSGIYNFRPTFADWIVEAFERIQIGPAVLDDPRYIISARRSGNILLNDWSGNRGVNLWAVGDETLNVPLVAGQASYVLPSNTVTLLDCYRRQYTPDTNFTTIGFSPQLVLQNGEPVLSAQGEPAMVGPGVGVFSTTAGSQFVTMEWPAHGLTPGSPIFFQMPVTAGAMTLTNFAIVAEVIDSNNITFLSPQPALVTRSGTGGTPLFVSHSGLPNITVVLSNNGFVSGMLFPIQIPVQVGGFLLSPGLYTVNEILTPHTFNIFPFPSAPLQPGLFLLGVPTSQTGGPQVLGDVGGMPLATSTQAVFENGAQLLVTSQAPGAQFSDIILLPISRNDYAALPNKNVQGTPSTFWFDRTVSPSVALWATPMNNSTWGFIAYRMREIQDADVTHTMDMPKRFFPAFTAGLTALLAEKFKPEIFDAKMMLYEMTWQRAADADREMVSSYIVPQFQSYYR